MGKASNREELGRRIRAAQAAVQDSMDRILEELDASAPDSARLAEFLRTFRVHAAAQYALEEHGGLMDGEVEDPGTDRLTDAMVERHRSIERRAEGLARLVERGGLGTLSEVEAIGGEVQQLLGDYGRQETDEIRLHQDLALRDTGGED